MKFLVVVIIVLCSFNLFGQNKDSLLTESNSLEMKKSHFMITGGSAIQKFDPLFLGLVYRIRVSKNIYLPIEGELFKIERTLGQLLSISIRVYIMINSKTNVYSQIGIGNLLPIPIKVVNSSLGINYKRIDVGIRLLFIPDIKTFNIPLVLLSIGVKL